MNETNKISKIKNLQEIKTKFLENLNQLARKGQAKTAVMVFGAIAALVIVATVIMHSGNSEVKNDVTSKTEAVKLDGTTDSQFSQDASQKALEEQQREIKDLNEKLSEIGGQMEFLQKTLDEKNQGEDGDTKITLQDLQLKIAELEVALKKADRPISSQENGAVAPGEISRGITTTNFSYDSSLASDIKGSVLGGIVMSAKTAKDYVPPGTFAKAVLLSGADTNAGVHGQTDTTPVTMRILDNGTLPNGEKSSLKGCFVIAAAYGDASSERGQIRLQRLSCIRSGGQILDLPVEGTINDMGGSDGIRGHVVMRNNKLIWNAGVSGILSGIGNAMQQATTTQSVSPLGVTSAIKPGRVFEHSAYGGANSALSKLADYYIKLADMYHPIVQIHAGAEVNIVFLKGFSLTEGMGLSESKSENKDTSSVSPSISPNLMESVKNSQLGQEINISGGNS